MNIGITGFNGERIDLVSGHSHPGNGYRAYSPVLMRFTCPDNLSPFGAGGINPYAYCAGDPVNHADPTGHLSWQAWLGIGMGIAGLGLALFTGGASIAAAVAAAAAESTAVAAAGTPVVAMLAWGAGVTADVTAIASGATEDKNPKASAVLGWMSLAAGLAGMAYGLSGVLKGTGSRPFGGLMMEGHGGGGPSKVIKTEGMPDVSGANSTFNLESLSNEIIQEIGSYLKGNDLVSFSNTSQRMSEIVKSIKFTERNFYHTPATENIPGPLNERLTQAFGIRQAMAGNATGVLTELMAMRENYQKIEEANRIILNHFHPQSVDYAVFRGRLVNEYIENIRNKYGVNMNELPADIGRMHQERINNYFPSVLGGTLPL